MAWAMLGLIVTVIAQIANRTLSDTELNAALTPHLTLPVTYTPRNTT